MDCGDRIAVLTVERTLGQVRALRDPSAGAAITARVHSMRRRFDVTLRRVPSAGDGAGAPSYAWDLLEVEADGTELAGGISAASTSAAPATFGDPEEAYWSAVEAISREAAAAKAATPASPEPRERRGDGASSRSCSSRR